MSPKKHSKINKLRKDLDKLDNSLIKLIKKRTNIINKVIKYKNFKNQIVDKIENNIDPKITHRIWKNMIWSYIDYERRNFKKK